MKATAASRLYSLMCYSVAGLGALTVWAQAHRSASATSTASPQKIDAPVPFVGCKSDGQVGPEDAPTGKSIRLPIASEVAQRLAYYKSQRSLAVLAPRGWHCFGTYGSAGTVLYVSPQAIDRAQVFSDSWTGFRGPAIEIDYVYGDTSGRFGVAKVSARVFPNRRAFVENLIKEQSKVGIESANSFPFGLYPKDKLIYRSSDMVEYETPANTEGLGTQWALKKNSDPIRGVAIIVGDTPDLVQLSTRLPASFADLTNVIIQQVERDAVDGAVDP
ncbi:MAG: hypothetical protein WA563_02805 [Candidatus Acidiferrales bacterium]